MTMTGTEAFKTLQRLGQGAAGMETATAASAAATTHYKGIQANRAVSEQRKLELLAKERNSRIEQLTAELATAAAKARGLAESDQRKVTGVHGIPGDPAVVAESRARADERLAGITNSVELRRAYDTAETNGNEAMLRACNQRAIELRDPEILNDFAASHPHIADAVERVWNNHQPTSTDTLGAMMGYGGIVHQFTPGPLQGMSEYQIQQLADAADAPNVPAADPVRGGW